MSIENCREIEALYSSEHQRLERMIARRIGSRHQARDIVHDIFLRLWERAGGWRDNPQAFLSRAARNAAIDHLRREQVRHTHLSEEKAVPGLSTPAEATDPSFEVLAAQENLRALAQAIETLPEQTRRLFLLNRVHGHSFARIAEDNGMSERNVAKHMARALAICARSIEEGAC
ncbi:MAG: RNA polymerase subunit sigma-70 [Alteromonadaceae bacterium]|nr:RNA polymerase subunit sigma-70 [Alteromonadaceae bacterium]